MLQELLDEIRPGRAVSPGVMVLGRGCEWQSSTARHQAAYSSKLQSRRDKPSGQSSGVRRPGWFSFRVQVQTPRRSGEQLPAGFTFASGRNRVFSCGHCQRGLASAVNDAIRGTYKAAATPTAAHFRRLSAARPNLSALADSRLVDAEKDAPIIMELSSPAYSFDVMSQNSPNA
jgi:hypothetical protein